MKKREAFNFKVNLANTDRLKNTSIITMQNMLNEDETECFNCFIDFLVAIVIQMFNNLN